jgi:excinuclease UvrABC nuclease subunit
MTSFETMEDLKAATIEQLEALPEMNRASAEAVYAFFHSG